MQEWFSHFLSGASGSIYEQYQLMRPDYQKSMSTLREKAKRILHTKTGDIAVLDVACGDAIATRQVFNNTNYSERRTIRYVGLDHDANLLAEAEHRWPQLEIHRADMVLRSMVSQGDVLPSGHPAHVSRHGQRCRKGEGGGSHGRKGHQIDQIQRLQPDSR